MHPYKRADRVGHLIKAEVTDIIMHRIKDPRLGFLTVTDVKVTPDLKLARVFVSVYREEEKAPTMEALEASRGFVRAELTHRLAMKVIPQVEFRLDTTPAYGDRIERLLGKLRKEEGR